MSSLVQIIRQYQKLHKKQQKLLDKKRKLMDKVRLLDSERTTMMSELKEIKTVIDFCVQSGCSPTEAKLRHTLAEMSDLMDVNRYFEQDYSSQFYTGYHSIGSSLSGISISQNPYNHTVSSAMGSTLTTTGLGLTTLVPNTGNITLTGSVKGSSSP